MDVKYGSHSPTLYLHTQFDIFIKYIGSSLKWPSINYGCLVGWYVDIQYLSSKFSLCRLHYWYTDYVDIYLVTHYYQSTILNRHSTIQFRCMYIYLQLPRYAWAFVSAAVLYMWTRYVVIFNFYLTIYYSNPRAPSSASTVIQLPRSSPFAVMMVAYLATSRVQGLHKLLLLKAPISPAAAPRNLAARMRVLGDASWFLRAHT